MFEDMNMMMAMGAMPGMMPGAAPGAQMPGMEGIPPEMQQMMQQMMASGVDPCLQPCKVARLAPLVPLELREATKVKLLGLREDLVRVKINMATTNNRTTVEEGILGEVEGAEEAGDTMTSTKSGVHLALEAKWSSGV
jgi:hypothetical protein